MGKNHRHKKHLKSEKAKIKLKGSKTKFLPKGQNLTDLSFKIKPIVLPQQLKAKGDEVLSSRNLNIKEILNRLNHYNVTIRSENLHQLKELISTADVIFLNINISPILKAIGPLLLDVEHKVRRESLRVLSLLLERTFALNITPSFDALLPFLCCAMTHINQNVQEDSLNVLDVLLSHLPHLIATNSHKILTNFFTLVSKQKQNMKHARTLSENLQSTYTGVKWRTAVLLRLKRIFEIICEEGMAASKKNRVKKDVKIIDLTKIHFFPIYIDKYENATGARRPDRQTFDDQYLQEYVETLAPILHGTWLEVAPLKVATQNLAKSSATVIKHETACVLNSSLSILCSLWELGQISEEENQTGNRFTFTNETCLNLINLIMSSFPFVGISDGRKNETFGVNNDNKCVEENLKVSYLFCIHYKQVRGNSVKYAQRILDYLTYCFTLFTRKGSYTTHSKRFLTIVEIVLKTNLISWNRAGISTATLTENALDYCLRTDRELKIELLCLLYDTTDETYQKRNLLLKKCADHLLREEISSKAVDFLSLMVKKETAALQVYLLEILNGILKNALDIKITGMEHERLKVIKILGLFYYVPLNDDAKESLGKFATENPIHKGFITTIITR